MKIVDLPRGCGKTFNLVKLSLKNNMPIIVMTEEGKKLCYEYAKGEDIVVYTLEEYLKLKNKPEKVYIDDGLDIIQKIFKESKIDILTFSSEEYQDNQYFILK